MKKSIAARPFTFWDAALFHHYQIFSDFYEIIRYRTRRRKMLKQGVLPTYQTMFPVASVMPMC
jgi:hypothetical protein